MLLEHADAIAERLALAGAQVAELAQEERVRLRIGAFPTALSGFVPAAVDRLRTRSPELKVIVDEGASDDLPARVRSGELHLAVAFQDAARPRREYPGLDRRDLLRERFVVALPPAHPLAGRDAVRLADLAEDDWSTASTDGMTVRACRAAGFEPRLVSITRDQLAISGLIARGLAVTLAPELMAEGFERVALRPIEGEAPERDVFVLLPPGGRHSLADAAVAALMELAGERSWR